MDLIITNIFHKNGQKFYNEKQQVQIPPKPEQKFTKTDLVLLTTSEAAADGIEDIACTLFPTMTRPLLSDVVVLLL